MHESYGVFAWAPSLPMYTLHFNMKRLRSLLMVWICMFRRLLSEHEIIWTRTTWRISWGDSNVRSDDSGHSEEGFHFVQIGILHNWCHAKGYTPNLRKWRIRALLVYRNVPLCRSKSTRGGVCPMEVGGICFGYLMELRDRALSSFV